MYYTLIRHINLFNIRNLSARAMLYKSVCFVVFVVWLYLWSIPFADFLILISYICIVENSRSVLKSHFDYAHLLFCSTSVFNKFILMYLSHLGNSKFLVFIIITIISVINGYFNIYHTLILLIVILISGFITLNIYLIAMRNIIAIYVSEVFFSIIWVLPFILIFNFENIRDRLTDFYDNNTFPVFLTLALLLPACLILNYRLFKYTVCRKPFPSPDVIEKIRKRRYFSLF
jgi:hypothetical protein